MKFFSKLIPAVFVLLLSCGSVGFAADDWPRFRGPDGNGHVSASADVPVEWDDKKGVACRIELPGPGASSPIVTGNRVFLTCYSGYGVDPANAGDQESLKRHALCFDLADGKRLWQHEVPSEHKVAEYTGRYITMHGYASSSPVTDGERVYFFMESSGVFAFSLDGKLLWQTDAGDGSHDWGAGASPILYKNLLIVNASAESDTLRALDKMSGKEIWSVSGMPRAWNTPLVVELDSGPELVVSIRGKILGLDPETGKELWSCQGINAAELCPSPVAHDGVIYILGHPGGEAMAVRAGGRGDVTGTHLLWRLKKGSNVGSPVFHDGHLYWASDKSGILYCVDASTGEIVYEERLQVRAAKFYASPILAGNRIYYVSRGSGTFVVEAAPEFRLIAHNTLSADPGPFNGSPAVVDGSLIIRSDRFVYRIGSK